MSLQFVEAKNTIAVFQFCVCVRAVAAVAVFNTAPIKYVAPSLASILFHFFNIIVVIIRLRLLICSNNKYYRILSRFFFLYFCSC